ncbi:PrsW family intramembrane metalloprotease [Nitrolancea hollandica]|uniref:PrsW family intramembrane metalloprotease n=1 Tax=Nitrolancea hollandica Lb TaxID=1129897 RepID=I4EKI9_9BACT|nr:PrsW family glutamic-type intramembrane protease [Nitrolancea hollandica]CCF85201.1 conserved membrane hypothetical protein [Nitrolancea hollandica Lb]
MRKADQTTPSGQPETKNDRQDVLEDIRSLPFSTLFPVSRWIEERPWTQRWVQLVLFFALFPMVLAILYSGGADLSFVVVSLGLYFALAWGLALHRIISPDSGSITGKRIALIAGFTGFVGITVLLSIQGFPLIRDLYGATESRYSVSRIIGFILGVGILEETTKALPVLWLAFKARDIRTPREAAFLAGISGLAFGVAEGGSYAIRNAIYLITTSDFSGYLLAQTLRMTTLPFLHCLWAAMVGYYVGLAILHPSKARSLVLVGIATSAVLHGLYDFFSDGFLGIAIFAITILLFASFARSADRISNQLHHQLAMEPSTPGTLPVDKEPETGTDR